LADSNFYQHKDLIFDIRKKLQIFKIEQTNEKRTRQTIQSIVPIRAGRRLHTGVIRFRCKSAWKRPRQNPQDDIANNISHYGLRTWFQYSSKSSIISRLRLGKGNKNRKNK